MTTEQNELTPEEQAALDNPSDSLTGFDMDDISIWGTKTRIEDLTHEEVKAMWSILRGYRREIISEAERADTATRENERLKAALFSIHRGATLAESANIPAWKIRRMAYNALHPAVDQSEKGS